MVSSLLEPRFVEGLGVTKRSRAIKFVCPLAVLYGM